LVVCALGASVGPNLVGIIINGDDGAAGHCPAVILVRDERAMAGGRQHDGQAAARVAERRCSTKARARASAASTSGHTDSIAGSIRRHFSGSGLDTVV
jgi:hypothetical protein